jgi:hypothetical protein
MEPNDEDKSLIALSHGTDVGAILVDIVLGVGLRLLQKRLQNEEM